MILFLLILLCILMEEFNGEMGMFYIVKGTQDLRSLCGSWLVDAKCLVLGF